MSDQLNPGIVFDGDESELGQEEMISVRLPGPQQVDPEFPYIDTGQRLVERCCAALVSDTANNRLPMPIRLVGPAGSGKNALIFHLANKLGRPLYIIQGHEELTPEEIVVSGAIRSDGKIEYIASPLVSAMVKGGICFFDEIGKVRPRGLAALASVLDDRRCAYSGLLGRWIKADSNFRFCSALNPEDPETFELPLYIISRTLEIKVEQPAPNILLDIVLGRNKKWEKSALAVIQRAKEREIILSARDILYIVDYMDRIRNLNPKADAVEIAIDCCIGEVDSQ